jgi:hypothetical protein
MLRPPTRLLTRLLAGLLLLSAGATRARAEGSPFVVDPASSSSASTSGAPA